MEFKGVLDCKRIQTNLWLQPLQPQITPLSSRFPLVFNLSDLKGVVVSSFFYFPFEWSLHLRMNLRDLEIQEYTELSAILQQLQPSVTRTYYRTWTIPPSGTFSVSSFFLTISSNPVAPLFPFSLSGFSFLFQSTRISLENCMEQWPYLRCYQSFYPHLTLLPNSCPLCLSAKESNEHLLLHCQFS